MDSFLDAVTALAEFRASENMICLSVNIPNPPPKENERVQAQAQFLIGGDQAALAGAMAQLLAEKDEFADTVGDAIHRATDGRVTLFFVGSKGGGRICIVEIDNEVVCRVPVV
jgi:hypothetical protein